MRTNRVLLLPIISIGILLVVASMLSAVFAGDSSRPIPPHPTIAASPSSLASQLHVLSAGLWRTDGSFVSTVRIKNVLVVAPMDVTPVIFMADGTPYMLSAVHLAFSGVATVNINDALAVAPPSVANHISPYGSAALLYSYSSPGHVMAQIAAIDAPRSLSFVFPFAEPMGEPMPQTLEGLWWKHDPGVSGFVALSNVTGTDTQASVQLVSAGNDAQAEHTIALPAHSTKMLHIEDFADNPSPLATRAGGIRVQYTGQPGSVQVTGGLENDAEGYSANIPFWGHAMSSASPGPITFASAGLMVGKPDPMMMPGFPKETTFSPYLVLRNTTEKPLEVSLGLNYMLGREGSAPVTRNLPAQHLGPFEARQVDMQAALSSSGLKSFNGLINLSTSFTGQAGDLVLAAGSVDQTASYVFEVEPEIVGTFRSKNTGYWGVSHGNDTMFALWNPTSTPQDILVTFYYGDGSGKYSLPVPLGPQASTMIDMAVLIAEQKPDPEGNVIPSNIQEGSVQFASAKGRNERITLVIAAGVYNVSTATCGGGCTNCCGDTNFGFSPNPIFCPVGQTGTCTSTAVDCNGLSVNPRWSSSNTAVMTIDNSGVMTGVSVGSATITAYFDNVIVMTGQMCGGYSCPTNSPAPGGPAHVFDGVLTPSDNFSGRSTTRFGIAETINLSFSSDTTAAALGGLQWSIVSGGGSLSNAGTDGTGTYTAPGSAATVVLRLAIVSGSSQGQKKDYTITIVALSGGLETKYSNVRHTQGYISVGFLAHFFFQPTDVSFANLQFAEGSAPAVASGYFAPLNGHLHPATSPPVQIGQCDSVIGCQVIGAADQVDTRDDPPPFSSGDFLWQIPWQYQAPGGVLTTFTTVDHHSTADATGTATISKAGAGPFSKNASDPTTTY